MTEQMMEDEEFFAWLDSELEGEAAARVAARVAASPELAAKAERHRKLAAGLKHAFEPVMEGGSAAPRFESSEVIDFGAKAAASDRRRRWFAVPQWAAMAASLAIGIFAGTQIAGRGGSVSPVAVEEGRLVAGAALAKSLDTRLASAPRNDGPRIALTFRDASGRICRSFTDVAASGLVCRNGEQWRLEGLFQAPEGQAGAYRMAAGEDPRLGAMIDERITGEPFDAVQEKAALERGWR